MACGILVLESFHFIFGKQNVKKPMLGIIFTSYQQRMPLYEFIYKLIYAKYIKEII